MDTSIVEKQVKVINVIIDSLDNLTILLKSINNLNTQIHKTISEILVYLDNAIKNLPELLISNEIKKFNRQLLIDKFDKVRITWDFFADAPKAFFENYSQFSVYWREFEQFLKRIDNTGNTFFLSLN